MISLLPNMRWLALPSEDLGRDWFVQAQKLDKTLLEEGMDLAEESTYLLYSHSPSDILEGVGECLVARSVIGPKKNIEAPLKLVDWVAQEVWRKEIQVKTWEEALEKAEDLRLLAQKELKNPVKNFVICLRRRLMPELVIEMVVMFNE